jgi:lysophospholipase L1-like esterase
MITRVRRPGGSFAMSAGAVVCTAVLCVAVPAVASRGSTDLGSADLGSADLGSADVGSGGAAAGAGEHWVAAWGASPVVGTPIPFLPGCPAGAGLADQTVRNVIFVSAGGRSVRVRLTNTFGLRSMRVDHAAVAVQAADAGAVPGTVRALRFGGRPEVTLAAGGRALSDPVPLSVAALSTLLVSVHVPGPTGPVTTHPFTAQGNFLAAGDRTLSATGTGFGSVPCWMLVDGIDVAAPDRVAGTVVALGDSITDTAATTGNANRRWPDDLARRLVSRRGRTLSVVNAGLGGNRVLEPRPDGDFWGVPALARLERDVFAQTGVRTVILLEGVNDIGFSASAADLIAGYQQVVAQTHERGLRIIGGTVTPFGGSFADTPERRQTWTAVNTWIRTSHAFDAVIDFAAATAAPDDPFRLRPAFDSGDHLHPNDAGCQAMADAVDLDRLLGSR